MRSFGFLFLNATASIFVIALNKVLLSSLGFQWGKFIMFVVTALIIAYPTAVTLCGLHYASTAAVSYFRSSQSSSSTTSRNVSFIGALFCEKRTQLWETNRRSCSDLATFTFLSNLSLSSLNLSLKFNSVGTYQVRFRDAPVSTVLLTRLQIFKISMVPCTYVLELAVFRKKASRLAIFSIFLVCFGVGTAYVT